MNAPSSTPESRPVARIAITSLGPRLRLLRQPRTMINQRRRAYMVAALWMLDEHAVA